MIVCRGAIATERRLLAEIDALAPTEPADLGLPVRVIVPSRSLRLHLLRRLVEERGAAAGVIIQTLGGAAREIAERAGMPDVVKPAGFDVLVRKLARDEAVLAAELDDLRDGYDAVLGAVRDLVDAGFGPDHDDAVLEKITDLAGQVPPSNLERAAALVRVAATALVGAESITGAHPRAAGFRLATEAIADLGEPVLPSRGLLIHGFADLTGVAADLLEEILKVLGGIVLLDRVPDPLRPAEDDPGNVFLERIEMRFGALARVTDTHGHTSPSIELCEAPDVEAEARWIAESVRELLSADEAPESIGVVGRRLGNIGLPLRRQLGRLGVPFSGVGATVPGGLLRRKARRLADLLERGGDAELDLWVEAAEGLEDEAMLLLGLRVLSLGRLRDLAGFGLDNPRVRRGVRLPVADGVLGPTEGDLERPRENLLPASVVDRGVLVARALVEALDGWPAQTVASDHLEYFVGLLLELGWDIDGGYGAEIFALAEGLAEEFPVGMDLDGDEWLTELRRRLEGTGEAPIGGRGGGVQVLDAMEARGRTFNHLFVCNLNRGVFPRQITDDSMMPDAVRARLESDVLPEMPVNARSVEEERYLFAQLLSSAPSVHASWHVRADGRRAAASPFVERFRAAKDEHVVVTSPQLWSPHRGGRGPRPAYEHAVLAAGAAGVEGSEDSLTLAVLEGEGVCGSMVTVVDAGRVARGKLDVVREIEAGSSPVDPGPWFGFVGDAVVPDDPLWITRIEDVAKCPFSSFVSRRLGVRPLPDPHFGLPDPNALLVGSVVHDVLEHIVTGGVRRERITFQQAASAEPKAVPWPSNQRLEEMLANAVERVVDREGLGGFGLKGLLKAAARPVLEVARGIEWPEGVLRGVLAAETEGFVTSDRTGRRIGFRADRLDEGSRATDYKSGQPVSVLKTPKGRRKHLVERVAKGRLLQAVAYALGASSAEGTGRYVFLKPFIGDAPDEARVAEVSVADEDLCSAFRVAVDVVESSLESGTAFPRVAEPQSDTTARHCDYCPVVEACRSDDPTFALRLKTLMENREVSGDGILEAARALWWLGVTRKEES